MTELSSETLHATTVAIGGRGLLLAGRPGSGKSDLALRLIDRGALLVADDYTALRRRGAILVATAPATIAGRMEVRGVGIVEVATLGEAPAVLLLDVEARPERMPMTATRRVAGIDLPVAALDPFEPSAPIKAELLLRGISA